MSSLVSGTASSGSTVTCETVPPETAQTREVVVLASRQLLEDPDARLPASASLDGVRTARDTAVQSRCPGLACQARRALGIVSQPV
mgnify:CR=1 FL=1